MIEASRRAGYTLLGAFLALGAPAGLLVVRAGRAGSFSPGWALAELSADRVTYLYLTLSTTLVLAAFGFVLGRQADRLLELSNTDEPTGLRNRRSLEARLREEFARALRYDSPLSVLLMDVDGLKEINDRSGHRAGDDALRRAAEAIGSGSRAADVGARWGGDEFVLLAPSTGGEDAFALAERVRRLVSVNASVVEGHVLTVSIGVVTLDPAEPLDDPEALVRLADAALYQAKRAGRDRVSGVRG